MPRSQTNDTETLADRWAGIARELGVEEKEDLTMKAVRIEQQSSGRWVAWIFSQSFEGTYQECVDWLQANGEYA
jgi:hypothetical protein